MAVASPTERSMNLLRKQGYLVSRAEHWNSFARKRFDLFGFIDLVGIVRGKAILAIQTTSAANMSARRKKIQASAAAEIWKAVGGQIHLHGWKKKNGRWECKEERL